MSDRVSEGLLAELQRKVDDGTPRGIVWPMQAQIVLMAANCIQTPEDAEAANEAVALLISAADEKAFDYMAMYACVDQLRDYLAAPAPPSP